MNQVCMCVGVCNATIQNRIRVYDYYEPGVHVCGCVVSVCVIVCVCV